MSLGTPVPKSTFNARCGVGPACRVVNIQPFTFAQRSPVQQTLGPGTVRYCGVWVHSHVLGTKTAHVGKVRGDRLSWHPSVRIQLPLGPLKKLGAGLAEGLVEELPQEHVAPSRGQVRQRDLIENISGFPPCRQVDQHGQLCRLEPVELFLRFNSPAPLQIASAVPAELFYLDRSDAALRSVPFLSPAPQQRPNLRRAGRRRGSSRRRSVVSRCLGCTLATRKITLR